MLVACTDSPAEPRRLAPAWRVEIVSGQGQTGEVGTSLPIPPAIRVLDAGGKPGTGWRVWFISSGQGSVAVDTTVTGFDGVASAARWTLGPVAGVQRLYATAGRDDFGTITASFRATAFPGPPAVVLVTLGDSAIALPGAELDSIEAEVTDRLGNGLHGVAVEWAVVEGGGSVAPSGRQTGPRGVARARWRLGPAIGRNRLAVAIANTAAYFTATAAAAAPLAASVVSAGGSHSCAVAASAGGATYCWGDNAQGALGREPFGTRAIHRSIGAPVPGAHAFTALDAGEGHTCGLTAAGAAYCWGSNWDGQLGDASAVGRAEPIAVRFDGVFSTVVAGAAHTCGLTPSGAAYCWGNNTFGQLGDGTTTSRAVPRLVGPVPRLTALAAGGWFTCALSDEGRVYCWGQNDSGQLGGPSPGVCEGPFYYYTSLPCGLVPQPLGGVPPPMVALAAGIGNACGTAQDGAPVCWGAGVTARVPIPLRLTSVVVGTGAACGLDADGAAYCWELGRAGTTPVRVGGGHRFASLDGFASHFCGVSKGGPPIAYCWGGNSYGQLGDGTTDARAEPVAVLSFVTP